MRAVTQNLGAFKAEACYFFNRFRQGKFFKGVGAVSEYHGWILIVSHKFLKKYWAMNLVPM